MGKAFSQKEKLPWAIFFCQNSFCKIVLRESFKKNIRDLNYTHKKGKYTVDFLKSVYHRKLS